MHAEPRATLSRLQLFHVKQFAAKGRRVAFVTSDNSREQGCSPDLQLGRVASLAALLFTLFRGLTFCVIYAMAPSISLALCKRPLQLLMKESTNENNPAGGQGCLVVVSWNTRLRRVLVSNSFPPKRQAHNSHRAPANKWSLQVQKLVSTASKSETPPNIPPPWLKTRRRQRGEVVEFFTRNPERKTLCLAKGRQQILVAWQAPCWRGQVSWMIAHAPLEIAEALDGDPGEAMSRAIYAVVPHMPKIKGDQAYVEHLWVDGEGGFEVSSIEIGGRLL
jgi:hypothetical protein